MNKEKLDLAPFILEMYETLEKNNLLNNKMKETYSYLKDNYHDVILSELDKLVLEQSSYNQLKEEDNVQSIN